MATTVPPVDVDPFYYIGCKVTYCYADKADAWGPGCMVSYQQIGTVEVHFHEEEYGGSMFISADGSARLKDLIAAVIAGKMKYSTLTIEFLSKDGETETYPAFKKLRRHAEKGQE